MNKVKLEKVEHKPNFNPSVKAHNFAKVLKASPGNFREISECVKLGFAVGLNLELFDDVECTSNVADTSSLDRDVMMLFLYSEKFPDKISESKQPWLDIEKITSNGIKHISEKYYDDQHNLIKWSELYEALIDS